MPDPTKPDEPFPPLTPGDPGDPVPIPYGWFPWVNCQGKVKRMPLFDHAKFTRELLWSLGHCVWPECPNGEYFWRVRAFDPTGCPNQPEWEYMRPCPDGEFQYTWDDDPCAIVVWPHHGSGCNGIAVNERRQCIEGCREPEDCNYDFPTGP